MDIDGLNELGYNILNQFGTPEGDRYTCSHLLVSNKSGNLMIVEVTPFKTTNCIRISEGDLAIIPTELQLAFNSVITRPSLGLCFLTHAGIDTYSFKKQSLLFTEAAKDAPKLNMGLKFYYPLPYVKGSDLRADQNADNLIKFIQEIPQISKFAELLQRSRCPNLLSSNQDAKGIPMWTVFAPSNESLKDLKLKHSDPTAFVLSYIFPGVVYHDDQDAVNLAGDVVKMHSGIPQGAKSLAKVVKTINGNITIISMKPIEPSKQLDLKFQCPVSNGVSNHDLIEISREIKQAQKLHNTKVKRDLKEKLDTLSRAVARTSDDDMLTSAQLSAINQALGQLVKSGRDL